MIKLTRVDHRLLHGQVTFSWVTALGIDAILIANDSLMSDDVRKTAIKLAKPAGTKLVLKNIEDSIEAINSGVTDKYKLLIVVESVDDAYRLINGCDQIKELNLGGVKNKENAIKIGAAVYCSVEELEQLNELVDKGISIDIRQIASDKKELYERRN